MLTTNIKSGDLNTELLFLETTTEIDDKIIYEIFRRGIDILVVLAAIVATFPILIVFGVLIKLESKGPIIYKQKRVGIRGTIFTIYKLRSMRIDAEKNGIQWAEKNDPRITKVGKFMRNTRIDELPQLFNVLLGDMSIIGPRPERPEFTCEFEQLIPGFIRRSVVKPGITGWAQVNGGYDIAPEEKFKLDMYYIKNRSILLDIKIVLKTIRVLFTGEGAR